jgi:hypothetical protein
MADQDWDEIKLSTRDQGNLVGESEDPLPD